MVVVRPRVKRGTEWPNKVSPEWSMHVKMKLPIECNNILMFLYSLILTREIGRENPMVRWEAADWCWRASHTGHEDEGLKICSHSAEISHSFFQNATSVFSQCQPGLRFRGKVQTTSTFIFEIKVYFLMEFLKHLPFPVCAALSLGWKEFIFGPLAILGLHAYCRGGDWWLCKFPVSPWRPRLWSVPLPRLKPLLPQWQKPAVSSQIL